METNINPEKLITLVQERGVLWDKTSNGYKDKQRKISAWREVCCLLIPEFDNLNEKERQTCGKLVSRKWSNLRDAWMRANKNYVKKSGAGAKFSKPYIYKEQMNFLQKVAEPNRTHESVKKRPTDTCPEAPEAKVKDKNSEVPLPSTSKKSMNLDDKMSQFLDSRLSTHKSEEHPMLPFFKGVLPCVTSFDDDETLEFQAGVLSLMQKIKKQRESRLHSNYGWNSRDHMQHFVHSSQNHNVHPPGNETILPLDGYGYSTRQAAEPASPAWSQVSQQSSSTQNSLDFNNF